MSFLIRLFRRGPKLALAYFSCFWSLITFLVLSSGVPALAEWIKVSDSDEEGRTVYVDPATIRRNKNLVKMWILYDFHTIQTSAARKPFLFGKMQRQYDCEEDRSRALAFTFFSGNMGKGEVVVTDSDENNKWAPVEPESIDEAFWRLACGKL